MLHDDIVLAQRVVGLATTNLVGDKMFHSTSCIYIKSNELINGYQKYLVNREKILSVIASGDQILNCILGGSKVIDAFDISVFPKYFLKLKMAALQGLSREEYISFFYGTIRPDEKFDDLYQGIRIFLEGDALSFWDSLFDFYDWYDIYHSTLFSTEPVITSHVISQNAYLEEDNYRVLSKMVRDVDVHTVEGDILDIYSRFSDSYDLVYLSNIIYYSDLERYRALLGKFHLRDQGIVLTYLYKTSLKLLRDFRDKKIDFQGIPNSECSLMLYHK